jgi:hypothetical protein
MLTYHVTAVFTDGRTERFDVQARDLGQAKQFGINTATMFARGHGIKSPLKSVDVEEFYDD